jgi:hypothetical protein
MLGGAGGSVVVQTCGKAEIDEFREMVAGQPSQWAPDPSERACLKKKMRPWETNAGLSPAWSSVSSRPDKATQWDIVSKKKKKKKTNKTLTRVKLDSSWRMAPRADLWPPHLRVPVCVWTYSQAPAYTWAHTHTHIHTSTHIHKDMETSNQINPCLSLMTCAFWIIRNLTWGHTDIHLHLVWLHVASGRVLELLS